MKIQLLKIEIVCWSNIYIEASERNRTRRLNPNDDDVILKQVYINPNFVLSINLKNEDDDMPMVKSLILMANGMSYQCADSVEDLVTQFQSLEFLK